MQSPNESENVRWGPLSHRQPCHSREHFVSCPSFLVMLIPTFFYFLSQSQLHHSSNFHIKYYYPGWTVLGIAEETDLSYSNESRFKSSLKEICTFSAQLYLKQDYLIPMENQNYYQYYLGGFKQFFRSQSCTKIYYYYLSRIYLLLFLVYFFFIT